MEWFFDRFASRTSKIWPFEAVGALGTAAMAKVPKRLGGLPQQKYVLEVF